MADNFVRKKVIVIACVLLSMNTGLFAQQKLPGTPCNTVNIVSNPNFTAGNTGFSSQIPVDGSCTSNSYTITTSLSNKCSGWPNIADHTQNGISPPYYMAIDGNPDSSMTDVWRQSVNVCATNTYTFSFWTYSVYTQSFTIGMTVGTSKVDVPVISAWGWVKHSRTWTAPSSGSVSIALIQNVGDHFTDFGIDDISFSSCDCNNINVNVQESSERRDDLKIYPNPGNSIFNIETTYHEQTTIEVYNTMGNKIISYEQNDMSSLIDLTTFPKDVYLIKYSNKNNNATKKLILQ